MFRSRLSMEAFLRLLSLFASNAESYRIAREIGVSRVTVSRILTALRARLAWQARRLEPGGRRLVFPEELLRAARQPYLRGRRPIGDAPVAALTCGGGRIASDLILNFPRVLWRYLDLELAGLECLQAARLLDTACALLDLQSFDVVLLAPSRESAGVRFRGEEATLVADFAEFVARHFRRVRGIPDDRLWLFLGEAEFRFNRRDEDLQQRLLEMLRLEPLRLS